MAKLSPEERLARGRVEQPLTVIVNPLVAREGGEPAIFFEGCLSVAGYTAAVPRAREVSVTGLDATGRPLALKLRGWPARIVQHEFDHVDGTLYVDRMLTRSFGTTAQNTERFGGRPIADVRAALGL
jgi:peptide deformylase